MKRTQTILSILTVFVLNLVAWADPTVSTNDSTQFFVEPNQNHSFIFQTENKEPVNFRLLTEKGSPLTSGKAEVKNGEFNIQCFVPKGYYELDFPDTNKQFGIVALPKFPLENRDPFFCIDGALSWLVSDEKRRDDYLTIAARIGISTIRDRLRWLEINPEENKFQWEAGSRYYEKIRKASQSKQVSVLEVWHDAPSWVGNCGSDGKTGTLPGDLIKTADSWTKISQRWQSTWAALEIWNEPDIGFSGHLPADQYVPLARALSYQLKKDGLQVPIVGGSLAAFNRDWLDTAIHCGLLDSIDAFSFHTYAKAPLTEKLFRDFSDTIRTHRPEMTFWLTECGRPWKRGVGRPPRNEDIESACDIIMKAVEAKTTGIDFYYAFVYPYYDENDNNFAMMDRWGSPLRSMAAYAQLIQTLSGLQAAAINAAPEIEHLSGTNLQRKRLFANSKDCVLVLYTGDTQTDTSVRLNKTDRTHWEAQTLTGETIPINQDGTLTFSDGLVYLHAKKDKIKRKIKINDTTRPILPKTTQTSPIVAVFKFDTTILEPSNEGYRIKKHQDTTIPVVMRIYNLDQQERTVRFQTDQAKNLRLADKNSQSMNIPARSWIDQTILAEPGDMPKNIVRFKYVLETDTQSPQPSKELKTTPIQLTFFQEPQWDKLIKKLPKLKPLPISNKEKWRHNIGANGKMEITATGKPSRPNEPPTPQVTAQITFQKGDRWVYPIFTLPDDVDLSHYKGIIIRAKYSAGETQARLMLFETNGSGYMTAPSMFPTDDQWHTAMIPFDSLSHVGATNPDPDGKLDLDRVRSFAIGANTKNEHLTIEISDCLLYK